MPDDTNTAATSALASALVNLFSGLATSLAALTATWPRVVGMGITLLFILLYTGKLTPPAPQLDQKQINLTLGNIAAKAADLQTALDTMQTSIELAKIATHNDIVAKTGELSSQLETMKPAPVVAPVTRTAKKAPAKAAPVASSGVSPIVP